MSSVWSFLVEVFNEWFAVKASRLGAALAYYSVFSLAPLLIIALGVAGMVFDHSTARGGIVKELENTLGEPAAAAIDGIVTNMQQQGTSGWATVIGGIIMLFGASGVFVELQDALNTIWRVKPRPDRTIWTAVSERFLSFAVVVSFGFLLLVSLVASAVLSAIAAWFTTALPGGAMLWQFANAVVSWMIIALLFALIFKLLPDVTLQWRHVWLGAAITSLLFTIGKSLIGLYIARSGAASAFGAAASLVVLLIWVYFSSQVFLLGALITRVVALHCGWVAEPTANAEAVTTRERANQGMPT